MDKKSSYTLEPVGFIRSTVKGREDAPRQGAEGAPDAWLEIEPRFTEALLGIEFGHELIVITWLHEAKRDVLKGYPRRDENRPLTGVFPGSQVQVGNEGTSERGKPITSRSRERGHRRDSNQFVRAGRMRRFRSRPPVHR